VTLYRLANDVSEGRAFSILYVQQSKEVDCPTLKMEVASSYETSATTYSLHGVTQPCRLDTSFWMCFVKVLLKSVFMLKVAV
jgi:hypothetical protein